MNLILIADRDVRDDGRIVIRGRRAEHIHTVLRPAPGDELRIGMIRGGRGLGLVRSLGESDAVILEPRWTEEPDEPPQIDVVLAMPRPKALARILQTCACMGVRRVDIVNTWRVDKSYLSSPQLSESAMEQNLWLGCEQGGTTWVPDVDVHRLLMPFMREALAERLAADSVRAVLAHPRDAPPLEQVLEAGTNKRVIAALGPERGWIDRELASFVELGFTAVSFGDRVLRSEIAVAVLLAQVSLLRRLPATTE